MNTLRVLVVAMLCVVLAYAAFAAQPSDAAGIVAALDTKYQAAVEQNDWQTMDKILHPEFALVLGDGRTFSRAELIDSARNATHLFEKQVEMPGTQTVRVFGDGTATVTALLWLKGRSPRDGVEFDYKLWFSDTYVRTKDGWRYAFGQASLRLP